LLSPEFDSKPEFSALEFPARRRKMRMKFNKSSQLLLVSAASLLVAGAITACGTLTTDFVYVATSKAAGPDSYGEIDVLEINAVSGSMRPIPTSPFPSGGRNPVAEAVSTDYTNLYVINRDDNTIVQFQIGPDGKLYPQSTVNTPGIYPFAATVNGKNLFVLDTYQPLPVCSNAQPCSGSVAVFPILAAQGTGSSATPAGGLGPAATNSANGAKYWPLSAPGSPNDVVAPTAINVLGSGGYAYVTGYDSTANTGYVFGFSIASGALTPLKAGAPLAVVPHPSAVTSDSTGKYLYVTDSNSGQLFAYTVSSDGSLSVLSGSPIPTGNQPSAIVADLKYPYLYVANALDGTVSGYSIGSNGVPASIGTYPAGIQPIAIGIDPSTNHFLFAVNFLANGASGTVSNFQINPAGGALVHAQLSPFKTNAQPTSVAAVPHKTF
jgi:6-phosphogluconolactonase (cycloisomerase 2 family)